MTSTMIRGNAAEMIQDTLSGVEVIMNKRRGGKEGQNCLDTHPEI
jgi:hypothetical protein